MIIIYCISVPYKKIYYKSYTFNFISVLYTFIILCCILIINFQQLTKKDWLVAWSLGLLSIGITIPITYIGILSSICTSIAYVTSISLVDSYKEKIHLFPHNGIQAIIKDIGIILIISIIIITLSWNKIIINQNILNFKIFFNPIFQSLGASISEEIIFIMFLYSILLKINEGEKIPIILTCIIISIPFSMIHAIDQIIQIGFYAAIPTIITSCFGNIIRVLLARKRNLFLAMGIHFMTDWISLALLNKY